MCPLTGGPPLEWLGGELTAAAGCGVCACCSGGSADWRSARRSSGGLIMWELG